MLGAHEYGRALEPLLRQAGGYAMSLLRNRQDAEDAVQTAALRGFERLSSFDDQRSFKGWWFAILRNCCIDGLRRGRRFPTVGLDVEIPDNRPEQPTPDWDALDRRLEALSSSHHEIVQLRYFGGLSYADIAETLSIPVGTVMSRLHHARAALAANLKENAG